MSNFAIIGPGAVGTTIAYDLQHNQPNLKLLGRRDQTLDFFVNGNSTEAHQLTVTALSDCDKKFDVIFIAVKIHQLSKVLTELDHLLHKDTTIILAQNGHGQLSKFKHPFVYQAVVYISGQKENDKVTHFRDHKLILKNTPQTEALRKELENTPLDIHLTDDIEKAIWYKLLVNLAINSVTALSRSTASVLTIPGINNLCENLLREGIEIAKFENVIFGEEIVTEIMTIYEGYPNAMGTSMYYDILDNKPLEIEGIQGFLYNKARLHDLQTPTLDTIYPLLLAQQKN
ncbi:oxidoreductase [Staphylococcus xylosus]|uniref:oxidoreductase n=1 Tax=Staphylococcus xylosus TaxID=1288 RepID=UPI0004F81C53|nr:oxidoreductase [Staphylococcus xylosus]MDO5515873.1 oxidoreductase [Staphylococcus xylosus]PTH93355.1 oxidoreductase [Staphylococcus xylosus]CEF17594.1 2-dehydropantoate 2-reductase [Staphylococcus xylosus]